MNHPRDLARQYQQQQIMNASAAQQVVMMYDGAIKFTMRAREAIAAGKIAERHENNRRAMEIVMYLSDILDVAKGGEVAVRLQRIYGYLIRRFMDVDFKNDVAVCDDILGHLQTLRSSWTAIARAESKPAAPTAGADQAAGTPPAGPKSAVA